MTSLRSDDSAAPLATVTPGPWAPQPTGPVPTRDPNDLRRRVPAQSLILELAERRAASAMAHPVAPGRRPAPLTEDERAWFQGAVGERRVAGILDTLGPEFTVLHSVPVGKGDSDIDHVVIGPSGVFTLNTKHHAGKKIWIGGRGMMVGGHKVPHIRNAAHEARRAEKLLSAASALTVPVTALIVLVGAGQITVRRPPEADGVRVLVIRDTQLAQTILTRPEFSADQVQRIAQAAASARTWHSSPVDDGDVSTHIAAFDELVGDVARRDTLARRGKLVWALAAAVLPIAAVWAGLSVILNFLAG